MWHQPTVIRQSRFEISETSFKTCHDLTLQKLHNYYLRCVNTSVRHFRFSDGLNGSITFDARSTFEPADAHAADFRSVLSHKPLLLLRVQPARDHGEINGTDATRRKESRFIEDLNVGVLDRL